MKTRILVIAVGLGSLASAADPTHLIRLYEEEILAHDLYVELGKVHPGVRPFQNIPHSEARHRDVMAGILNQEGIAIPEPHKGKRFVTPDLDQTYRKWLREGRKSEVDACRIGVRLEDHDIADLRAAQADFKKHRQALASLEAASENHLRAFYRQLTNRGGNYAVEALGATDFTKIVEGDRQRGDCGAECSKPCQAEGQQENSGRDRAGRAGHCRACDCDAPRAGRGSNKRAGNGRGRQRLRR